MIIDNNDVLVRAGLPPKRKFSERLKYDQTYKHIMDEAARGSGNSDEAFTGLVQLNCAMAGMDLVPYNNIDIMDRETHWKWILLSDAEYWVVPREGFYD